MGSKSIDPVILMLGARRTSSIAPPTPGRLNPGKENRYQLDSGLLRAPELILVKDTQLCLRYINNIKLNMSDTTVCLFYYFYAVHR